MTEQLKAEAYVRKQRPALYKPEYSVCSAHQVALDKECANCQTGWVSPNLQDWLAVLRERLDESRWHLKSDGRVMWEDYGVNFEKLKFNLTTGQPATEADYEAFNEITSV